LRRTSFTTPQGLATLSQLLIAAGRARASNSASVRLKIAPLGVAGAECIFDLFTKTRHPSFRTAAVARYQAGCDAMFHFIVHAHRQFLVTDALHAPKTGIGGTQFATRERHAGAECDAGCGQDSKLLRSCESAMSFDRTYPHIVWRPCWRKEATVYESVFVSGLNNPRGLAAYTSPKVALVVPSSRRTIRTA
jgi:hypothetical protein